MTKTLSPCLLGCWQRIHVESVTSNLHAQQALSFIAEIYKEWEDCEPEGSFFSQVSPHLKPDTIRKIHTPTVEFSVIRSGFKASMLVKCACTCFSERA